jgi:hypothetical protein
MLPTRLFSFVREPQHTVGRENQTERTGPDSLVIDLDGGVVMWGDEAIPITSIKGNFIEFESKEDKIRAADSHKYSGTIDRVTGTGSLQDNWLRELPDIHEEIIYNYTCKRTNPVF